jgi:hypothetical protein
MTAGPPTPRVLLRSEDSDGEISVIETAPGPGVSPPLHHHDFDEAFYVMPDWALQPIPEVTTIGPPIAERPS